MVRRSDDFDERGLARGVGATDPDTDPEAETFVNDVETQPDHTGPDHASPHKAGPNQTGPDDAAATDITPSAAPGVDGLPRRGAGLSSHPLSDPDDPAGPLPAPPGDVPPVIAGYEVLGEVGRGGMGSVLMARKQGDRFRKRVAIKIMRRGMDTQDLLDRFELERQVLGALNHPNVARVFDAGSTQDGRPFFVMEYVEGVPIDVYCDERNLSIAERLRLFEKVCSAIHYAHTNLIVHRDLKPSNILVTPAGEPKLLDFGIAKLLNPELLGLPAMTRPDQRLMTYEYASPEQVKGGHISTASDVYALGVLLYELLTGHRPYELVSRIHDEAVRVICEQEPQRPSTAVSRAGTRFTGGGKTETLTADEIARRREMQPLKLRKKLAGDLDNIVLMAMRKNPLRRYQTAQALADDIDRHLGGLTVAARPPTFGYRTAKFVRRNRVPVTAAVSLFLALCVGFTTTAAMWQQEQDARQAAVAAQEAEADARRRADERFEQLAKLLRRTAAAEERLARTPGATLAREVYSASLVDILDDLADEFRDDERLRLWLADGYRRAGRLAAAAETDVELGADALQRSIDELDAIADGDPAALLQDRLAVLVELAEAQSKPGRGADALATATRAAELAAPAAPGDPEIRRLRARALQLRGKELAIARRFDDARPAVAEALELATGARADLGDTRDALETLASAYDEIGRLARLERRAADSLEPLQRQVELRRRVLALDRDDPVAAANLSLALIRLSQTLAENEVARPDDAIDAARESIDIADRLAEADPYNRQVLILFEYGYEAYAKAVSRSGDPAAAAAVYTAMADRVAREVDRAPSDINRRRLLGDALRLLGIERYRERAWSAAAAAFADAVRAFDAALQIEPDAPDLLRPAVVAAYRRGLALSFQTEPDPAAARLAWLRAIEYLERLERLDALNGNLPAYQADTLRQLAVASLTLDNDGNAALAYLDRAAEISAEGDREKLWRASALRAAGKGEDALLLARATVNDMRARAALTDAERGVLAELESLVEALERDDP